MLAAGVLCTSAIWLGGLLSDRLLPALSVITFVAFHGALRRKQATCTICMQTYNAYMLAKYMYCTNLLTIHR